MRKIKLKLLPCEADGLADAIRLFNNFGFIDEPVKIHRGAEGFSLKICCSDAGLFFGQEELLKPLSQFGRKRLLKEAMVQLRSIAEKHRGEAGAARSLERLQQHAKRRLS